jgi:hypothetical protein
MKKKLFWILGIIIAIPLITVMVVIYMGNNTSQFSGPVSAGDPLPPALIADLEKYVARLMGQFDVPVYPWCSFGVTKSS